MADQRGDIRSSFKPAERPALEDAPTVLSRNPFHLDNEIAAAEELDRTAPPREIATPVAHVDDRTRVSSRPPDSSGSSISGANPFQLGQALEGEHLGHFHLEKFVGGGGMGAVFRALDTMLGRVVAVKVLSRERTDADTLRRFKNEAQSAARLDHKNIARVHYVGEDSGWNYIVFEFIDGVNVRDMTEENGPLDVEDALHFTMQIAEALDHAAQRDVVHRDIKPSNIIVTPGGRAKLVDMGLARLHQVESSNDDITASGVTLGTFDYISPEQARDPRAADVRSDIYSLGCTLYFMLCGRPPFPDGTVLQKLLSHNSDRPPDLQIFRPDVPDDIVAVVDRMLAKQPSQRFQTPAELMSELVLIAQKYQLGKVTAPTELWSETAPVEPPAWERHLPWMAPLAILVCTVVAMEMWIPAAQPNLGDLDSAAVAAQHRPMSDQAAPADTASPAVAVPDASPSQPATGSADDRPRPPTPAGDAADPVPPPATATPTSDTTSLPEANAPLAAAPPPANASATPKPPAEPVGNGAPAPAHGESPPVQPPPAAPPEVEPAPKAVPVAGPGVLVVSRGASDQETIQLLLDRLRLAAASDKIDEIQLDFDGSLTFTTTIPIDAAHLRVTAAAGRTPELRYIPAADRLGSSPRGSQNRSAMIALNARNFELSGVRLTMVAADEISSDGWTMIRCGPLTEQLTIRDSVLTMNNPLAAQFDAAFIRLQPHLASRMGMDDDAPAIPESTQIVLERCIARGEATFLRSKPGKPVSLAWDQGLLATSERLLDVENVVGDSAASARERIVRLSLSYVTAVAEKGLCRLGGNSEPASSPMRLEVALNGCIVRTLPEAPLVEQLGVDPQIDPQNLFNWEPSGTLFSQSKIKHAFSGREPERMTPDSMSWMNPLPDPDSKPWHEHQVDDYLPAPPAADDETSVTRAGFDRSRLPAELPKPAETSIDEAAL